MKHFVRDCLVYLAAHSGLAARHARRSKEQGPLVRVLCLHDVPDREWFRAVVTHLVTNYHVLTPAEFRAGAFSPNQINLLITFDDGYASWVEVVQPVLNEHGVTALFFVNSGLLDVAEAGDEAVAHFVRDRLHLTQPHPLLTWAGAQELVAAGHVIGGHTATHVRLSTLAEAALPAEIETDKKTLETKLGVTLTDFAVPFGREVDYTNAALDCARKAGYTHVYGAETGFTLGTPTVIHRTLIEEQQSISSIDRWVRGAYDVISAIRH